MLVQVAVPDGVAAGQDFIMTTEDGRELTITCPDGCSGGSMLELEVPPADGQSEAGGPSTVQEVEVAVPDGCVAGQEFTVEFDGREFNVCVPDGCGPGVLIKVEVPAAEPSAEEVPEDIREESPSPPPLPPPPPPPPPPPASTQFGSVPTFTFGAAPPPPPSTALGGAPSTAKFFAVGDSSAGAKEKDKAKKGEWAPQPSLFSMGPPGGFSGEPAGEFVVGQLVQVNRTDGSWTYGKVMEYDEGACNYTIMTKAGPKYFVERDTISDDIVVNPSTGECAQQ